MNKNSNNFAFRVL